jgi:hypothetical protein
MSAALMGMALGCGAAAVFILIAIDMLQRKMRRTGYR